MKLFPFPQTSFISVIRRKIIRRKKSLSQLVTQPLNQLPLHKLKKRHNLYFLRATLSRRYLLILSLKLLQIWIILKDLLNSKATLLLWLMPVLAVKMCSLKTSLK
jgi:hypothetical protein